ncbi:MAG: SpaA isopeptide-forming pilin-related protein [Bilifractor sp.]|jgi:surface protein
MKYYKKAISIILSLLFVLMPLAGPVSAQTASAQESAGTDSVTDSSAPDTDAAADPDAASTDDPVSSGNSAGTSSTSENVNTDSSGNSSASDDTADSSASGSGEEQKTGEETIPSSASGFSGDYQMKAVRISDTAVLSRLKNVLGDREIVDPLDIAVTEGSVEDPEKGVTVTLSGYSLGDPDHTGLYHIEDFSTDHPSAEKLDYSYDSNAKTVTFTAKSFSPFVFAVMTSEEQKAAEEQKKSTDGDSEKTDASSGTGTDSTADTENVSGSTDGASGNSSSSAAESSGETQNSSAESGQSAASADESGSAPRFSLKVKKTASRRAAAAQKTVDSFKTTISFGAEKDSSGRNVWTADTNAANHGFIYRAAYSMSGEGNYDAGEVVFTFPKTLLKDRDGNAADTYVVSVPEYSETDLTDADIWAYKEEGDHILVYNRVSIPAAQSGYIEIQYSTSKETFYYRDYDGTDSSASSSSFTATLKAGSQTLSGSVDPVYIDTSVEVKQTTKIHQSWQYYSSWQSSWGDPPAGLDVSGDYIYVLWNVKTNISATGMYDFTLADNFSPYGQAVAWKFDGEDSFTTSDTLKDQTKDYSVYPRYDTVITRMKASEYQNQDSYTVVNKVTASVKPKDGADPVSSKTDSCSWYYERISHIKEPPGYWDCDKFGLNAFGQNAIVTSGTYEAQQYGYDSWNEDDYYVADDSTELCLVGNEVEDFISGDSSTLGSFPYISALYAFAYRWTLPDGASSGDPANYGKIPVTYQMTDEKLTLYDSDSGTAVSLGADDYTISGVDLLYCAYDGSFDSNYNRYYGVSADYSDDVIRLYAKKGSGAYALAASYHPGTGTWTDVSGSYVKSTDGIQVKFADGVSGYRLETSNKHYYSYLGAKPYVTLKRSEKVLNYVRNHSDLVILRNTADYSLKRNGSELLGKKSETGSAYTGEEEKEGSIRKDLVSYKNDAKHSSTTVTWSSEIYEKNKTQNTYVKQSSGTFYDLLPEGAQFKSGSVIVQADGETLKEGQYTVSTTDNYKGSGRTMVTVRLDSPAEKYFLTYSTVHSWDVLKDLGSDLLNTCAYETGNKKIGKGYQDSPYRPADSDQGQAEISEKEWMTDLDSETDAPKFMYAEKKASINVPTSTSIGLYKKVKAEEDDYYQSEATTYPGGLYSYKLRFSTDSETTAKDLVLVDSLENFTGSDGKASDWRGTLVSVDTTELTAMGMNPVIFYKTDSFPDLSGFTPDSLTSANGWSTAMPSDPSAVKAIAIDMRRTSENREFVLGTDQAVSATVYMRAPAKEPSGSEDPTAYNNVYLYSTTINGSKSSSSLIHKDNTRIHCHTRGDLKLLKVDSTNTAKTVEGATYRLYGTSDYGTAVDREMTTNRNGELTFLGIEKGTYSLREEDSVSDYQIDDTVRTVVIDGNGTASVDQMTADSSGRYVLSDEPRVHGDLEFRKMGTQDGSDALKVLEGVEFKLSGVSDYGNTVQVYESSDETGTVRFSDIEKGTYQLQEMAAPDGYIRPANPKWTVTCDSDGVVSVSGITQNSSGDTVITNEPYHSLKLVKKDETNGNVLAGAKFRLFGTSDYGRSVDVTATTDSSGLVSFTGLESGTYLLQETAAPSGYYPDSAKRAVSIAKDGTVTVEGLEDDGSGRIVVLDRPIPTGRVVVTKKWKDGLTGADAAGRNYPNIHIEAQEESSSSSAKAAVFDEEVSDETASGESLLSGAKSALSSLGKMLSGTVTVYAAGNIANGKWGTCNWTIDSAGTLTIGPGVGESIPSGSSKYAKWLDYKDKIKKVKVTGTVKPASDGEMANLFNGCSNLETADLTGFNTTNARTMSGLFSGCTSLKSVRFGSGFSTANVVYMPNMFMDCSSLETLDLSGFRSDKLNSTYQMFSGCSSMKSVTFGENFTLSKTKLMTRMFAECSSLTSLDTSRFRTTNATDMAGMFSGCSSLKSLDLSHFDMSSSHLTGFNSRTGIERMLSGCSSLTSLTLGSGVVLAKQGYTAGLPGLPSSEKYTGNWAMTTPYNHSGAVTSSALMSSYSTYGEGKAVTWVREKRESYRKYEQVYQSDDGIVWKNGSATGIHNVYDVSAGTSGYSSTGKSSDTDSFVDQNGDLTGFWTKVSDDTWTYTFFVYDPDVEWDVWEDTPYQSGGVSYTTDYTENSRLTVDYTNGINKEAVVTNTRPATYGNLSLKKQLVDENGNSLSDDETAFPFTVTLTDQSGNALSGTAVYGSTAFSDGVAHVSLKTGESVTFTDIPAGYHYSISEDAGYEAYSPSWSGNPSGTIAADSTASATCRNTRPETQRETISFTLEKSCPEDTETEFPFRVSLSDLVPDETYQYTAAGKTVSFTADASGAAILTLSLKNGEKAVFTAPAGSAYQVSEEASAFVASYTLEDANGLGRIVSEEGTNTQSRTALSTEKETADMDDSGGKEDVTITFTNRKQRFPVTFTKRDGSDMFVEGATLQILGDDGNVVADAEGSQAEWTTSDGENRTFSLPAGEYALHEKAAPSDYAWARDIAFSVGEDGTVAVENADGAENADNRMITMVDKKLAELPDASSRGSVRVIALLCVAAALAVVLCFRHGKKRVH